MSATHYSILQCPVTKESLSEVKYSDIKDSLIPLTLPFDINKIDSGLINSSRTLFYPILNGVILLLDYYSIPLIGNEKRVNMNFDKKRVFDYYNDLNVFISDELNVQTDSAKWVDYREVSRDYIRNSLSNSAEFIPSEGEYFLDIASGTVGFREYVELSKNFKTRICVDISYPSLLHAKQNMKGQDTLFICGDITNIPLKENVCDVVVSHHTLYHVPKDEQANGVNEMYRVTKPGKKVLIIYSFFYHSWLMNLTLLPVQFYRIARHFAGKIYVRLFNKTPRLYFYPHSRRWFKTNFSFSENIEIYNWRSLNKFFLNVFVHKNFGGKKLLDYISKLEKTKSKFMGSIGEYATIVIKKD